LHTSPRSCTCRMDAVDQENGDDEQTRPAPRTARPNEAQRSPALYGVCDSWASRKQVLLTAGGSPREFFISCFQTCFLFCFLFCSVSCYPWRIAAIINELGGTGRGTNGVHQKARAACTAFTRTPWRIACPLHVARSSGNSLLLVCVSYRLRAFAKQTEVAAIIDAFGLMSILRGYTHTD